MRLCRLNNPQPDARLRALTIVFFLRTSAILEQAQMALGLASVGLYRFAEQRAIYRLVPDVSGAEVTMLRD